MKNPKAPSKGSSHRPSSSSSTPSAAGASGHASRKSRWESDQPHPEPPKPSPKQSHPKDDRSGSSSGAGGPPVAVAPQPPPPYGFHNLERRTIVLADGSVRSYFALPPDYPLEPPPRPGDPHGPLGFPFDKRFPPPGGPRFGSPEDFREPPPHLRRPHDGPQHDYWASLGLDGPRDGGAPSSFKRKYGDEDGFAWHRQSVLQYGNPNANPGDRDRGDFFGGGGHNDFRQSKQGRLEGEGYEDLPSRRGRREEDVPVGADVDKQALKKAFLTYVKLINENLSQRKNYLEDGRNGPLQCIVCGRASKEFADVHCLVMHAFSSQNAEIRIEHLGLHKALCVLMGWNFAKAPENSKGYQSLSLDDAASNREDLILWPPAVIIHNTNSGRRKDGRMEGVGNKEMDIRLKEMGFGGGKSKSLYGKEGHLGVTLVKFANTQTGLKEAERLAEYFEKDGHGRRGWARAQASQTGIDDERNPALVRVDEKTGEKKRIFYAHLATASDLDNVDFDTRKRAAFKSKKDLDFSE